MKTARAPVLSLGLIAPAGAAASPPADAAGEPESTPRDHGQSQDTRCRPAAEENLL